MAETKVLAAGERFYTGRPEASTITGNMTADVLFGAAASAPGAPVAVRRVTMGLDSLGIPVNANGASTIVPGASMSADGRYVAFASRALNLAPGVVFPPGVSQVFRLDRHTGQVRLVSKVGAVPGSGDSTEPVISPDGRFVAFTTRAQNIIGGSLGTISQVALGDLETGAVSIVSRARKDGVLGSGNSSAPRISPDGALVAFRSDATNLVVGSAPNPPQSLYAVAGATWGSMTMISANAAGAPANGPSDPAAFSPQGNRIAFASMGSNLLPVGAADVNPKADVFVRPISSADLAVSGGFLKTAVTLASADAAGVQSDLTSCESWAPAFTPGGSGVVFLSTCDTLNGGKDANGIDVDVLVKRIDGFTAKAKGPVTTISSEYAGLAEFVPATPVVSPDGMRVAVAMVHPLGSKPSRIAVAELPTGAPPALLEPAWSVVSTIAGGGVLANGHSFAPAFAPDGRTILYASDGTNHTAGDTNAKTDVFAADLPAFVAAAADLIDGADGADQLYGTDFGDTLAGASGDDLLVGRGGNDKANGGAGRDRILSGAGADTLTGGADPDVFVYVAPTDAPVAPSPAEVITDFDAQGGDRIDLSAIDANTKVAGNQAFDFVGAQGFTGTPGQLRFAGGFLYGDADGNQVADLTVKITIVSGPITAANIVP